MIPNGDTTHGQRKTAHHAGMGTIFPSQTAHPVARPHETMTGASVTIRLARAVRAELILAISPRIIPTNASRAWIVVMTCRALTGDRAAHIVRRCDIGAASRQQ